MNYTYTASHFPNNFSWYRELVHLDDVLVGEIAESTDSRLAQRIYRVLKYVPFEVADGYVDITEPIAQFTTVSDCKDFINNGGIK